MCPPKAPSAQPVIQAPVAQQAAPFDPEAEARAQRRQDLEAKRNSRDKLRIDRSTVAAPTTGSGVFIA